MINKKANKEKMKYPHILIHKAGAYGIYIKEGERIEFDSTNDLNKFVEENNLPIYIKG